MFKYSGADNEILPSISMLKRCSKDGALLLDFGVKSPPSPSKLSALEELARLCN